MIVLRLFNRCRAQNILKKVQKDFFERPCCGGPGISGRCGAFYPKRIAFEFRLPGARLRLVQI
jgi:hypothetical protein